MEVFAFSHRKAPAIVFPCLNLGSPYVQNQSPGSDSPSKLNGLLGHHQQHNHHHSAPFVAGGHPNHLSPQSTHAFNLAAFRTPGFLNAHGFAFGANFGYRDHSPPAGTASGQFEPLNPLHSQSSPNAAFVNALPHHPGHHHLHPIGGGIGQNNNSNSSPPHHLQYTAPGTPSPGAITDSPPRPPPFLANDYYSPVAGLNNNNNNNLHHHKKSSDDHQQTPPSHQTHHHHLHRSSSSAGLDFGGASNNDQGSSRADSESPELQIRDTNSPDHHKGDGTATTPGAHGFHSPHHPATDDSIGSRSPENLSASGKAMLDHHTSLQNHHHHLQQQQQHQHLMHGGGGGAGAGHPHKLPLSFLGPPLAALHSMTEMKAAATAGSGQTSVTQSSPTGAQTHHTTGAANPHGIDTILSRPPPSAAVTSAGLSALSNGGAISPRFTIAAAAAAGMAQYLSQSQQNQLKAHTGQLVDRSHLYWPGLQGLVTNPMAWRERLTTSMSQSLQQHQQLDKDGKKKHTRPTFSGQQIFALEKTFEQTKYLAGPERAKLAYALGMTESQVKVWFQNRRTKWRKKHAAEMATAKRKQEELGDGDAGECSEAMDSDAESIDLGHQEQRKRCRMDDDMRQ